MSSAPAGLPDPVLSAAADTAGRILAALGVVGVACVEFFVTKDGRVLVNEIAPRTHNSGHLTIEACETSQFEQQVRAVCGLPLGGRCVQFGAGVCAGHSVTRDETLVLRGDVSVPSGLQRLI